MKILVKLIYKLFKTQLNLLIASEQCRPKGFVNMEQIFIDSNGKRYYRFNNINETPLERIGMLSTFLMWLNMGLGTFTIQGKKQVLELDLILNEIESALNEGLKKTDTVARIGAMIAEIRDRKNMVIHHELLYNLLAVQWVREDEMPDIYNAAIQLEKINQFKIEVKKSNSYFFFAKSKLSELLPYLKMTEQEWKEFWQISEAKMMQLQSKLDLRLAEQELEKLMKQENNI
jgi:hypothetical protein